MSGFSNVGVVILIDEDQLTSVLNTTKMQLITCDRQVARKFYRIAPRCPSLRAIVLMDPITALLFSFSSPLFLVLLLLVLIFIQDAEDVPLGEAPPGVRVMTFAELELLGSSNIREGIVTASNDISTIVYTRYFLLIPSNYMMLGSRQCRCFCANIITSLYHHSGSTGVPKGAVFTEQAVMTIFDRRRKPETVRISYTMKISARKNDWAALCYGGRIGVFSGVRLFLLRCF